MKVIFDPKPFRTFAIGVVYPLGWRHEGPKNHGILRKSLDEIVEVIKNLSKPWFHVRKIIEAEHSYVEIFGEMDVDPFDLMRKVDSANPEWFVEMEVGIDFVVLAGSFKKSVVDEIEAFRPIHEVKRYPKIITRPRRFLSLKELSRIEKHFLVRIAIERGLELFLELSKRGDRIHYGKKIGKIEIDSIDLEIKKYRLEILRKRESTLESVRTLINFNVFKNEIITFDDILEDIEKLRVHELSKALFDIERISP